MNNNDFKILHLSDLHYPSLSEKSRKDLKNTINSLCINSPSKPKIIIVTGDITSEGNDRYLKEGMEYLDEISVICNDIPILLTPGNHDVKWASDVTDYFYWNKNERYNNFISSFSTSRLAPKGYRPRLLEQEVYNPAFIGEIDELIKDIGNGKLKNDNRFPFFWDIENSIFIYLLSSADKSGEFYLPIEDDSYKNPGDLLNHLNKLSSGDNSEINKLIKNAYSKDIPYVDENQLENFKSICKKFSEDSITKEKFKESVKIIALHHPLVEVENNIREYKNIGNRNEVLSVLKKYNFSLVLSGHSHKNEAIVSFGEFRIMDDNKHERIPEFISIQTSTKESNDKATYVSCNLIKIKKLDIKNNIRTLSYKKIDTHNGTENGKEDLFTIDCGGNIRWLYNGLLNHDSSLNERFTKNDKLFDLSRVQDFSVYLSSKIRSIEEILLKVSEYKNFTDVDNYIFDFLDFIEGYTTTLYDKEYGLEESFQTQIIEDCTSKGALYFIDKLGSSSWINPTFISHLAKQIRLFNIRNIEALSDKIDYSNFLNEILRGKSSGEFSKGNKKINLEICRVLLWDEVSLNQFSTKIIIQLHRIFNIPLFFLNKKTAEDEGIFPSNDYHFVYDNINSLDSNALKLPDDFWVLKKINKKLKRVKLDYSIRSEESQAKRLLNEFDALINHPETRVLNYEDITN